MKQIFNRIIPFIILFGLLALLGQQLYSARPKQIPGALVGDTVSNFNLPNLFQPAPSFTEKDIQGKVSLLNVWASWCEACVEENDVLMKIKNQYHIPIYGVNYKDDPQDAKQWLKKRGNPYEKVGSDRDGNVAVDLGIYGTPETFIINRDGQIVYRQVGSITDSVWESLLYPIILKYQSEQ